MLYFRAQEQGALASYMADGRTGPLAHGTCWHDLCANLRVIDVPGNHYSLLRQPRADMEPILSAMRRALEPFGWTERHVPQQRLFTLSQEEAEELTGMLGVEAGRDQVHDTSLPFAAHEQVLRERGTEVNVVELGAAADARVFVVWDGVVGGALAEALRGVGGTVALEIQQLQIVADRNQTHTLAGVLARRVLAIQAQGPFVIAGVGNAAALAYDTCLLLQGVCKDIG